MCLTPLDMLLSANKQWGYIESLSGTRDLNLPLAYVNRHLCVVATGGNTKGYGAIRAQTISLTQVRLYAYTPEDGAYSHYLSLGYQLQWGKSTSTGEYVTHTFPIKFTVIPIVVAGALTSNTSGNTGSQSNPCYRSITVSNFVFCMYDNARGYAGSTYIAIGYQLQWGFDSGTTEKNIVILPLPVINPLAGFACLTDSNGTGDIGIKSMSSTSIVVDVDTNKAASRNFYWLVIAL